MKRVALVVTAALIGIACKGKVDAPAGPGNGNPGGNGNGNGGNGNGGTGGGMNPGGVEMPPMPPPPYEPISAAAAAAKVKDLLTGLPLSDDELRTAAGGRNGLKTLIDGWMTTPQWKEKLFDLGKQAFQQTQLDITDLDDQLRLDSANVSTADQRKMLDAVEASFPRTMMALVEEGRPFTETVTTTRFALNVPMMVSLAYMDAAPRGDTGRQVTAGYWLMNKYGGAMFKMQMVTGLDPVTGVVAPPIPVEESLNPASPNFMKWTFAQPDPMRYPPCAEPVVSMGTRGFERAFGAMYGSRDACQGSPSVPSVFTDADWNTFRMVTIRQPAAGEERTAFWDLAKLRDPNTKELVLATPRVGFLTTPAFFANWPTNPSNSYRVSTNQALIVALGRSFDDQSTTVQVSETSVDAQHVEPGSVCFACHQTLDPMRDFFKQTYSLTYFQQLDLANKRNPIPAEGVFSVDGVTVRGRGIEAFAKAIAEHPRFAIAWTLKLCHQANASACYEDDPEVQRVANAFRDAKFDFRVLVRELYSSPLVTYSEKTFTTDRDGPTIGIARRELLCARLSSRLGITDACNLRGQSTLARNIATSARNLSFGIAGSSYARADEKPVMPHDPNLFFMSATEKLCTLLAAQVVETMTARWKVATKDAAFDEFVGAVMGVPPSDERAPLLRAALVRHYDAAIVAKEKPADALRSTFVLACSAPSAISSGL
jgi:hypothetical protein